MWSLGRPQHFFFAICTEAKVNLDHLPKSDILLETYSRTLRGGKTSSFRGAILGKTGKTEVLP